MLNITTVLQQKLEICQNLANNDIIYSILWTQFIILFIKNNKIRSIWVKFVANYEYSILDSPKIFS